MSERRAAMRPESLFEAIDQKDICHRRTSSLVFGGKSHRFRPLKSYAIGNVSADRGSSHDGHGTAGGASLSHL
jgi:hypothetical protein